MGGANASHTGGLDSTPHALIYAALRDRWRAAEGRPSPIPRLRDDGAPWERTELARFCRRIGAIPKTWSESRAADAVQQTVEHMAAASGDSPHEACAVLLDFCADDGAESVCRAEPRCAECPVEEHCGYPDRRLTIKDLPAAQRPRERLIEAGEESLSDVELLAIIIRDGSGKETALQLAERLLAAHTSFRKLAQCTVGELTRVNGIGPAKGAQIKAALAIARRYAGERLTPGTIVSGSRELFAYMRAKLHGLKKEHFYTLLLDTKHRIIREEQVAVGSLNESVVHPREVFSSAIREGAAKVVFVHNHPSGNPEPSPQDRRLTARLCQAGELVGIHVLDHLIIGEEEYFSFAERGLLGPGTASA
jgi:DNA repair protein RadC